MEIGNIVKLLLIAAVCLLSVLANGKKKKPRGTGLPLPQEASHPQTAERKRPLGFAIPHLKGAPPQPPAPDDDGVYREQAPRAAGEQARPSAAPAQPAPRGRVDVSVDDAGVMREPGVLASEAAERLREQMADAARAEAYALARRAEEARARAEEAARYASEAKLPGLREDAAHRRRLTPQTAREAVVLAAIIGAPKAFRSRGWRGGRRT